MRGPHWLEHAIRRRLTSQGITFAESDPRDDVLRRRIDRHLLKYTRIRAAVNDLLMDVVATGGYRDFFGSLQRPNASETDDDEPP
jgi:hypothetical protein